jgi:RNA polymerase sigma factor (TIGR02999 family)
VAAAPGEATRLLERVRAGDEDASRELFERLYADMRRIAGRLFRGQRRGHTLDATALVHEAFLKVAGRGNEARWKDGAHALAVAARAMRQVLANHARDRAAHKRGGGLSRARVTLAAVADPAAAGSGGEVDLLDLHDALERLAALDERQGRIAEMRLLGGLPLETIATLLGVSLRTVELDWRMAKETLGRALGRGSSTGRREPEGE